MMMNSQHLEYFCKVAEFGSFSRAAIFLGINQSALSRHVRNLEQDLGILLFYRNGRGVVLTDFGERLLARAGRALEEIALAKQDAVNARTESIASVVIGMTPTVGRLLIQPLARELTTAFPNIKLRFMEGFSGHLLEWLDAGRLDVAVLYQGWAGGRLHAERLIAEKLCLVSSRMAKKLKTKTPTAELQNVSLILPSAPHGLRRLVDLAAADQKLSLKIVIEADSFESILSLVKDNLGSTVLPACAIQDELSRQQLQASLLVKPEVMRTLILATPTNRPPVRGFAHISKTIKREMKRFDASVSEA
jgi:LysR family nitrogen assimilation transcriptional regulator